MFAVPTVRVVSSVAPGGFVIINEADLRDDHQIWSERPLVAGLRIGKGPRGRWYVWSGQERIEGPFESEAEADTALNARSEG